MMSVGDSIIEGGTVKKEREDENTLEYIVLLTVNLITPFLKLTVDSSKPRNEI